MKHREDGLALVTALLFLRVFKVCICAYGGINRCRLVCGLGHVYIFTQISLPTHEMTQLEVVNLYRCLANPGAGGLYQWACSIWWVLFNEYIGLMWRRLFWSVAFGNRPCLHHAPATRLTQTDTTTANKRSWINAGAFPLYLYTVVFAPPEAVSYCLSIVAVMLWCVRTRRWP